MSKRKKLGAGSPREPSPDGPEKEWVHREIRMERTGHPPAHPDDGPTVAHVSETYYSSVEGESHVFFAARSEHEMEQLVHLISRQFPGSHMEAMPATCPMAGCSNWDYLLEYSPAPRGEECHLETTVADPAAYLVDLLDLLHAEGKQFEVATQLRTEPHRDGGELRYSMVGGVAIDGPAAKEVLERCVQPWLASFRCATCGDEWFEIDHQSNDEGVPEPSCGGDEPGGHRGGAQPEICETCRKEIPKGKGVAIVMSHGVDLDTLLSPSDYALYHQACVPVTVTSPGTCRTCGKVHVEMTPQCPSGTDTCKACGEPILPEELDTTYRGPEGVMRFHNRCMKKGFEKGAVPSPPGPSQGRETVEEDSPGVSESDVFGNEYPTLVREVLNLAREEAKRRGFRLMNVFLRDDAAMEVYVVLNAEVMLGRRTVPIPKPTDPGADSRAVAMLTRREAAERGLTILLLNLEEVDGGTGGDTPVFCFGDRKLIEEYRHLSEKAEGHPLVQIDYTQLFPWPTEEEG